MSSSSARMIGDAPTIWTALRCDSTRLMALSSDPAQTKSMRSTSVMSIGTIGPALREFGNGSRAATFDDPASTPVNTSLSASSSALTPRMPSSTPRPARVAGGRRDCGHRRRLPRRRRLLERDRILDRAIVEGLLLVLELQELERQEPRALAAVPAALDHGVHGDA